MSVSLISKVSGELLVKKRLRHRYFPVNYAKLLRTAINSTIVQTAVNNNPK